MRVKNVQIDCEAFMNSRAEVGRNTHIKQAGNKHINPLCLALSEDYWLRTKTSKKFAPNQDSGMHKAQFVYAR